MPLLKTITHAQMNGNQDAGGGIGECIFDEVVKQTRGRAAIQKKKDDDVKGVKGVTRCRLVRCDDVVLADRIHQDIGRMALPVDQHERQRWGSPFS